MKDDNVTTLSMSSYQLAEKLGMIELTDEILDKLQPVNMQGMMFLSWTLLKITCDHAQELIEQLEHTHPNESLRLPSILLSQEACNLMDEAISHMVNETECAEKAKKEKK